MYYERTDRMNTKKNERYLHGNNLIRMIATVHRSTPFSPCQICIIRRSSVQYTIRNHRKADKGSINDTHYRLLISGDTARLSCCCKNLLQENIFNMLPPFSKGHLFG